MPAYARLNDFMQRVRAANAHFERVRNSSLHALIDILKSATGSAAQVENALAALSLQKTLKYKAALYFLQGTYPGLTPNIVQFGPLGKSNAARFTQTGVPPAYNPGMPALDRVVAPSVFLNRTIEQFILQSPVPPGILLIHLSTWIANMNDVFDGDKVVDHMRSVLRVGVDNGCDLCVLYQNAPVVCQELDPVVNAFLPRTAVHIHPQHMGARDANFRNFAANHTAVIVMGFDASVCVRANMFGSSETMPGGGAAAWVRPLVTLTDVVTSRAVLVTSGNIAPFHHRGEYGVLFNT